MITGFSYHAHLLAEACKAHACGGLLDIMNQADGIHVDLEGSNDRDSQLRVCSEVE